MKLASNAAESVVKMILAACDAKQPVGIFGKLMIDYATKEQEGSITDEDRALFEKMKVLKNAEDSGDLVWMEYTSWNALNARLRMEWDKILQPLFWNGVFCTYSNFLVHEMPLLRRLGPNIVVNLVRFGKNYQLFCVESDNREYNLMKVKDFDKICKRVNATLVKSYALDSVKLVVKEFKYKTDERGNNVRTSNTQEDNTTTAVVRAIERKEHRGNTEGASDIVGVSGVHEPRGPDGDLGPHL